MKSNIPEIILIVNHDKEIIKAHIANHPIMDVQLIWNSIDCFPGFCLAKGKQKEKLK